MPLRQPDIDDLRDYWVTGASPLVRAAASENQRAIQFDHALNVAIAAELEQVAGLLDAAASAQDDIDPTAVADRNLSAQLRERARARRRAHVAPVTDR